MMEQHARAAVDVRVGVLRLAVFLEDARGDVGGELDEAEEGV